MTVDEHNIITVNYTVTNVGAVWAASSQTDIDFDGTSVAQPCPALGPSDNYTDSVGPEHIPFPCDVSFDVTVCADWDDDVIESD